MLTELAEVFIARLEAKFPGLVDEAIADLAAGSLNLPIVAIRGARFSSARITARHQALVFLTDLAPLVRGRGRFKPRKRRR